MLINILSAGVSGTSGTCGKKKNVFKNCDATI